MDNNYFFKFFYDYSYDTEALNKKCLNFPEADVKLENVFQESFNKKINFGIQQLYIIGKFFEFFMKKKIFLLICISFFRAL
jgi:hypothetical protein